jgi:hypothetical protein
LPIPREEPVTIDTGASTSLIGSDTAGSVVAKACALTPHHLPGLAELLEQGAKNAPRETNAECTQTLTSMHEKESGRKTTGEDVRRKRGEGTTGGEDEGGEDGRRKRGSRKQAEKTRGEKTAGENEGAENRRRRRGEKRRPEKTRGQKIGGEDEEDGKHGERTAYQEEHLIAANHTTANPD